MQAGPERERKREREREREERERERERRAGPDRSKCKGINALAFAV